MSNPTIASLKTWAKFLFWYAVAAILEQAIQTIGNIGIPDMWVPIAAAVLKAIATFVATKRQESQLFG